MAIQNLDQAATRMSEIVTALDELRQFFGGATQAVSNVNSLMRGGSVPPPEQTVPLNQHGRDTRTWGEGVFQILREAQRPMMQKDIMAEYKRRGWQVPDNDRKCYIAIAGAVNYLATKRKLIERTENGYQVKG